VLVVTNRGPAQTAFVQNGALTAELSLEPDSVTTWLWPK
jgi:hypothetical protein